MGERFGEAGGRGAAVDEGVELAHEHADAGRQHGVARGGQQVADAQPAVREAQSGHGEDGDLQQRDDGGGLCGGAALDLPHAVAVLGEAGQRPQDALALAVGGACRGDGPQAAQGLDEAAREVALEPLVGGEAVGGGAGEGPQQQGEYGGLRRGR
ncbi:hypothetical protein GCM10020000_57340 [Streptomyces olivoverticillatus]